MSKRKLELQPLSFVVNMNGDSKETLKENYREVLDAANVLKEALAKASPHGRNYQYDGGDSDYGVDRETWVDAQTMVDNIHYIAYNAAIKAYDS